MNVKKSKFRQLVLDKDATETNAFVLRKSEYKMKDSSVLRKNETVTLELKNSKRYEFFVDDIFDGHLILREKGRKKGFSFVSFIKLTLGL